MIHLPLPLLKKLNLFMELNPELVFTYYLLKIKSSIDKGHKLCLLYKSSDKTYTLAVKREHYIPFLESLIKIAIDKELYEYAKQCRILIDRIEIDNVIESSVGYD